MTLDDNDKYSYGLPMSMDSAPLVHVLKNCPWKKHGGPTLYHTGELVDILVGCFSAPQIHMLLRAWSADSFHSPSLFGAWIWGRGYAKLPVHEFLLAVDDSPQKFELLIGIARREATFQPMRDFDCKYRKAPPKSTGRASRAIQSLSYMIYVFSPYRWGGSSDDLFQMVFLLFSSRDNAKQQIKCFVCSFYSGFFRAELRYPVLWCSSYLCLKPGSRLLQILIFISLLFTITIVCSCLRKKFVSRFHRTGKLILGYWLVLFLRCCDLASFGFHEHLANFFSFRMHAPTRMKYSFTLPKTSSWVRGPLKMGRFTPQKGR